MFFVKIEKLTDKAFVPRKLRKDLGKSKLKWSDKALVFNSKWPLLLTKHFQLRMILLFPMTSVLQCKISFHFYQFLSSNWLLTLSEAIDFSKRNSWFIKWNYLCVHGAKLYGLTNRVYVWVHMIPKRRFYLKKAKRMGRIKTSRRWIYVLNDRSTLFDYYQANLSPEKRIMSGPDMCHMPMFKLKFSKAFSTLQAASAVIRDYKF